MDTSITSTIYEKNISDIKRNVDLNKKENVLKTLRNVDKKMKSLESKRHDKHRFDDDFMLPNNSEYNGNIGNHFMSAEIQCQLLEQQIGFMKRILRKPHGNCYSDKFHFKTPDLSHCNKNFKSFGDEILAKHMVEKKSVASCKNNNLKHTNNCDIGWKMGPCVKLKDNPIKKRNHYKVDLKKLPFVAGTSTSESHSLNANIQQVISSMKRHNNNLCGRMECSNKVASRCRCNKMNGNDTKLDIISRSKSQLKVINLEIEKLRQLILNSSNESIKYELWKMFDEIVELMIVKKNHLQLFHPIHYDQLKYDANSNDTKETGCKSSNSQALRNMKILRSLLE